MLYNSVGDGKLTDNILTDVKKQIGQCLTDQETEIEKITSTIIMRAAIKMKNKKNYISQGFSSDCLHHCPPIFFEILSLVFKSWLCHGCVSRHLLGVSILPIVKPLKDPADTAGYRAISGISLILRLMEKVVLLLWEERIPTDTLQF